MWWNFTSWQAVVVFVGVSAEKLWSARRWWDHRGSVLVGSQCHDWCRHTGSSMSVWVSLLYCQRCVFLPSYCTIVMNETKACFRHLSYRPACKQISPIAQFPGPTRLLIVWFDRIESSHSALYGRHSAGCNTMYSQPLFSAGDFDL